MINFALKKKYKCQNPVNENLKKNFIDSCDDVQLKPHTAMSLPAAGFSLSTKPKTSGRVVKMIPAKLPQTAPVAPPLQRCDRDHLSQSGGHGGPSLLAGSCRLSVCTPLILHLDSGSFYFRPGGPLLAVFTSPL